jgi:phosphoribosylamine--glycine ligase
VTATGPDLAAARAVAYSRVSTVDFTGMQFRADIASAAIRGDITVRQ